MTDFDALLQPDRGQPAHDLIPIVEKGFDDWLKAQPEAVRTLATAARFKGMGTDEFMRFLRD